MLRYLAMSYSFPFPIHSNSMNGEAMRYVWAQKEKLWYKKFVDYYFGNFHGPDLNRRLHGDPIFRKKFHSANQPCPYTGPPDLNLLVKSLSKHRIDQRRPNRPFCPSGPRLLDPKCPQKCPTWHQAFMAIIPGPVPQVVQRTPYSPRRARHRGHPQQMRILSCSLLALSHRFFCCTKLLCIYIALAC